VTPFLAADLKHDEGCELAAYLDTKGIWTVGVGHAHVPEGTIWTQAQCDAALSADIAKAVGLLDQHCAPWWRGLNDARQDVLAMLCFNMGWGDGAHGLSSFHNTLQALRLGEYAGAARGLLSSKWAADVRAARANRLATQLRTGVRVAPV
jgi:lysozyme